MKLTIELPLYESIKRDLQARIESGELPEGARILPEIELAQQSGVSRSTARKALQALEMEGYLSRTAGRGSFVKARHRGDSGALEDRGTMALTLFKVHGELHSAQILQGFMVYASSHGFHALLHPQIIEGSDEFEYLVGLRRHPADGWALWLHRATEKNLGLLRHFQRSGGALVLLDRFAPTLECDYVVTRNDDMTFDLTSELVRRGHRHIGFINFVHGSTVIEERHAGYCRALAAAGIPFEDDLVVTDLIQGNDALRMQILALLGLRRRPTAVICDSGHHARLLNEELERLGYAVPGDIELAAVDDNNLDAETEYPVLCARQRSFEMGHIAAELLHRRIEHPDAEWRRVRLDYDLNFTPGGETGTGFMNSSPLPPPSTEGASLPADGEG